MSIAPEDWAENRETLFCQELGAVNQFILNELKDDRWFNLGFSIQRHVAKADCQRNVAKCVEQSEIEPCPECAALGIEVIELKL